MYNFNCLWDGSAQECHVILHIGKGEIIMDEQKRYVERILELLEKINDVRFLRCVYIIVSDYIEKELE